MQGFEHIALKGDASAVVQRLDSTRDLRRVEFLVLVRGQGGVHVRDKCRDRQRVGGGVGRAEEVDDRVASEMQPLFSPASPQKTREHAYGEGGHKVWENEQKRPHPKGDCGAREGKSGSDNDRWRAICRDKDMRDGMTNSKRVARSSRKL